jgi:hypothetical protein
MDKIRELVSYGEPRRAIPMYQQIIDSKQTKELPFTELLELLRKIGDLIMVNDRSRGELYQQSRLGTIILEDLKKSQNANWAEWGFEMFDPIVRILRMSRSTDELKEYFKTLSRVGTLTRSEKMKMALALTKNLELDAAYDLIKPELLASAHTFEVQDVYLYYCERLLGKVLSRSYDKKRANELMNRVDLNIISSYCANFGKNLGTKYDAGRAARIVFAFGMKDSVERALNFLADYAEKTNGVPPVMVYKRLIDCAKYHGETDMIIQGYEEVRNYHPNNLILLGHTAQAVCLAYLKKKDYNNAKDALQLLIKTNSRELGNGNRGSVYNPILDKVRKIPEFSDLVAEIESSMTSKKQGKAKR